MRKLPVYPLPEGTQTTSPELTTLVPDPEFSVEVHAGGCALDTNPNNNALINSDFLTKFAQLEFKKGLKTTAK